MAITSSRTIQVQFNGDITLSVIQSALDNVTSVGNIFIQTLVIGDNYLIPPAVIGLLITGLTIILPAGNTTLVLLKKLITDAGIPLHKTDPTSIGLDITFGPYIVLNAAAQINGVQIIWS